MFKGKLLTKILLFLVSVVLIVLCLPKDSEHHYPHEVNRPWSYSLLTAPFDIPVYLDSISVKRLKDSIDRDYEPVYRRDLTLEKTSISTFAHRLNTSKDVHLSPAQRNVMLEVMKQIFENGIVSIDTDADIHSGKMPSVRFITDNVAISVPTKEFLSTREAYAYLDSAMRGTDFRNALALTRPSDILLPNIVLDTLENERLLNDQYQKALAPIGVIQKGERIIDRGEVVTPALAMILDTYERMANERSAGAVNTHYYPILGQILFVAQLLMVLFLYLYVFRQKFFKHTKMIIFVLLIIVGFTLFSAVMHVSVEGGLYMVPLTIVPIMTVTFLDSRTGLFVHLVTVMICAAMAVFPIEYIVMQYVAGCVAVDSIKDMSKRSQLVRTALYVLFSYCVSYVAIEVMMNGSVEGLQPRMFGNLAINAVLVSFTYILLFIFEKLFGFTSLVTLVELTDINNPTLRKLQNECPGTFQHSLAVSNLAAAAAAKVGANVLLVRAGALYHDIGKVENPVFYTENQHGVNPHDSLDPMQSARIVVSHVTEGVKRADKAKLPEVVKKFIREHHGTGTAKYFYNTYCNAHPGEDVPREPFSYPGPIPQSRETAILMMADAIEAASRSLKDFSPESLRNLVNKIIDSQVADGQFNDSQLSFRDIRDIKEAFAKGLETVFHPRISYPELNKKPE